MSRPRLFCRRCATGRLCRCRSATIISMIWRCEIGETLRRFVRERTNLRLGCFNEMGDHLAAIGSVLAPCPARKGGPGPDSPPRRAGPPPQPAGGFDRDRFRTQGRAPRDQCLEACRVLKISPLGRTTMSSLSFETSIPITRASIFTLPCTTGLAKCRFRRPKRLFGFNGAADGEPS
jgi:hypothetical protein